ECFLGEDYSRLTITQFSIMVAKAPIDQLDELWTRASPKLDEKQKDMILMRIPHPGKAPNSYRAQQRKRHPDKAPVQEPHILSAQQKAVLIRKPHILSEQDTVKILKENLGELSTESGLK